jgi:CRP/FNR family cyclic AMP-dependent transcriptional regulator
MDDRSKLPESLSFAEKIPAFHGLSPSQIRQLLQKTSVQEIPSGRVLCSQGETSDSLYILLSGEVSVQMDHVELTRMHSVDMIGEMGVLTDRPRCATVQTTEPSRLLVISRESLQVSFELDDEVRSLMYRNVLDSVAEKLRESNLHLVENLSGDHGKIVVSTI